MATTRKSKSRKRKARKDSMCAVAYTREEGLAVGQCIVNALEHLDPPKGIADEAREFLDRMLAMAGLVECDDCGILCRAEDACVTECDE